MAAPLSGKKIAKNAAMSVTAQLVSVLVGFVLNLVVPKYISEYDYSYWQTFLLYSQYLGILHFGLLDGIVLRYSQYDYGELDKKSVRSQYLAVMAADLVLSLVLLFWALFFFTGVNRVLGILLACIICIEISYNYISFTFQITNRIFRYVAYIAAYRTVYCVLVLGCLIAGLGEYYWFCMVYLAADLAVILYFGLRYSRELLVGRLLPAGTLLKELKESISVGIWLMLSSYAANFLVGSGKMIIQWRWGALTFGKISLAFSLSSFVLQFVTAVSVVLFPSIKRMDAGKLPDMYCKIRNAISPLMFLAMIFYYPGCVLLELWLPKYVESVRYLGILLPIVIYTSKVSLLTNNYLKAYRKERAMLLINVGSVVFGAALFLICAWGVGSLTALLVAIVLVIMLRSVLSEIIVTRVIGIRLWKEFVLEFAMTVLFMTGAALPVRWQGCLLYGLCLGVYYYIKRREIRGLFRSVHKKKAD